MLKNYKYNKSIQLLINKKVLKSKELTYINDRLGYGLVKGKPLKIED